MGKKAPDTKRNIMERVADYFSFFLEAIKENMWVRNEEISFREIAEKEGYIRGTLYLGNWKKITYAYRAELLFVFKA